MNKKDMFPINVLNNNYIKMQICFFKGLFMGKSKISPITNKVPNGRENLLTFFMQLANSYCKRGSNFQIISMVDDGQHMCFMKSEMICN